jgi:hypothetical protein
VEPELRRILGPKRDAVTGVWRKLHNELHNLYSSPRNIRMIKSRRMRWRNAYRTLVGKPERKRPFGRLICRWVDNIRMDLRETGLDSVDWIHMAQNRDQWRTYVNMVLNLRVP